ncbi:MAG: CoA-binding protein [Spirochaetes bacterium]|nr:MAG: CoA-binding protein [Spirochaetota bacterium]
MGLEKMKGGSISDYQRLKYLFRPGSIAVVGASERSRPGRQVIENLQRLGFVGKIFPVNPRYREVMGLPCYPSLKEVRESGEEIEMAAFLLGKDKILPLLEEMADFGVKAGWAFASGFGEAGEEGKNLQRRLSHLCTEKGINFLGPNCVGYLNFSEKTAAYSSPAPMEIRRGRIGMVGQSGYLCMAVANSGRKLGFSLVCSTGNEAVVDSTDCISYMLDDPHTGVIMAFIEQFRNPEKLRLIAERAYRIGKPIILIKVGRSEMAKRVAMAHTGALAGSDDVQDALFKKMGIIRVNDLDEMFETAMLFSKLKERMPSGNNIFAITLSGGLISLLADLSENTSIRFPQWSEKGKEKVRKLLPDYVEAANPLDAWGYGRIDETYQECLTTVADEPEADLVFISQDVPGGMATDQAEEYSVVAESAVRVAAKTDKPIVMVSNTSSGFHPDIESILDKAGVPLLQGTREALSAVDHLIYYSEFRRSINIEGDREKAERRKVYFDNLIEDNRHVLTEYESKRVFRSYGIPCTEEYLCKHPEEAVKAAERIGYPVVLKVMSPHIQHKTDARVVELGIKDEEELLRAYSEILVRAHKSDSETRIDGVLCQQMAEEPVAEAIAGVICDPHFGPAVVFGLGGVFVEILKDRSLGVPPLSRREAEKMIDSIKGRKLLEGYRGRPPADREALIDVLIKVGKLAVDWQERIEALEINPLFIYPEGRGVLAIDALFVLKEE